MRVNVVLQCNVHVNRNYRRCCYFISYYDTTIWVWTLGLWAVVNNAGINFRGDLELCLMDYYRRCHDVNLYGPIRIIKTFLPQIRKSKGWFDSMHCFYYQYLHLDGCCGHARIVIWLTAYLCNQCLPLPQIVLFYVLDTNLIQTHVIKLISDGRWDLIHQ